MTGPICIRCARPLADGSYVCDRCAAQTAHKLTEIAEVAPAARDTANGLSRSSQGGATGKPGSRLPLDLTAMAKLDGVQGVLGTWLRHVAEERGSDTTMVLPLPLEEPIVLWAERLLQHLEWMRHRPEADEFLTDVEACRRIVRGIVRGPADQRYLGPCGAVAVLVDAFDDEFEHEQPPCDGDVYVRGDARTGRCKTCGAEVDRGDREAWLDGEVRQRAFTRTDIADAYGIKDNTITVWCKRGKLKGYWVTDAGLHVEWIELVPDPALKDEALAKREREIKAEHKARGPKVFYLGDVLDLAVAEVARREENRATRARRVAARVTESENAA